MEGPGDAAVREPHAAERPMIPPRAKQPQVRGICRVEPGMQWRAFKEVWQHNRTYEAAISRYRLQLLSRRCSCFAVSQAIAGGVRNQNAGTRQTTGEACV
jgi:hypothetical protein